MGFFGKSKTKVQPKTITYVKGDGWGEIILRMFGEDATTSSVSPEGAYKFYRQVGPLHSTVSKIAKSIGTLPLVLKEEIKTNNLIKKSPALDVIRNPSPNHTQIQFLSDLAISMMLTNEIWILKTATSSRVYEMECVNPQKVSIHTIARSEFPTDIYIERNGSSHKFSQQDIKGSYRWFDKSGINELVPYIYEEETGKLSDFRAESPLTAIKAELMSYISSVAGNTKAMDNAGKPSGIITPKDDNLSEDQYEELADSFKDNVSGADNEGKIILLPARIEAAFKDWAPKDMNYQELQLNVKNTIWETYSMPKPMVSSEGQSYSNFMEAQTAYYDEAVDECWQIVADALRKSLVPHYPKLKNFIIGYNANEIPALRRRSVKAMKEAKESDALTLDEIRRSAGYDELPEDGDTLLVSTASAPLRLVMDPENFEARTSTGDSTTTRREFDTDHDANVKPGSDQRPD